MAKKEDSGNCQEGPSWQGLDKNANISNLQRAKEAKPLAAVANQRFLNAKTSIADIAAKVKNDRWELVRKLTQAHVVST